MSLLSWPDFGSGRSGQIARSIVGIEGCKNCGETSTHTIGVDVLGDEEQFASCDACHELIFQILYHDLIAMGKLGVMNTFSINGNGRA